MIMKRNLLLLIILIVSCTLVKAQTGNSIPIKETYRKSTEIGLGIDMHNLSRVGFQSYTSSEEGDRYRIKMRDVMFGGNIYIARELNPWLYIDLQGTIGMAKALDASSIPNDKNRLFAMVGPGIQFRLTPLFKRKYVEPYFRAGINYYYKDFLVARSSRIENFRGDYLEWTQSDEFNNNVDTKRSFFPFSFGFGVNSWFNDHFGFGIQGDYLTGFSSKRLSFPRVLARIMVRFGSSKEPRRSPEIQYVERIVTKEVPVERIVEKEVVVEKVATDSLMLLFENINFDFDKSTLTAESQKVLDSAAAILKSKEEAGHHFLITGFTDVIGTIEYNKKLSERRAATVVKALVERGVSARMLKSRGVGKCAASMPYSATDSAREGDRKVTIELIQNMEYWNKLP